MTREEIQTRALEALVSNNGGTVVLSPGTGKSKVAIDFSNTIKSLDGSGIRAILITSPRTSLKNNWNNEIKKWSDSRVISNEHVSSVGNLLYRLENIQTCYKWTKEDLKGFDLIIADEVHTFVTEEYGKLLINAKELGIPVVGLTGTPDDKKLDKYAFYHNHCPIVYRYLDSAKDGIINKRKYIIYEHELSNTDQVQVGYGKKKWWTGELKQYEYLQSRLEKAEQDIRDILISELRLKLPSIRVSSVEGKEEEGNELLISIRDGILREIADLQNPEHYVNYFGKSEGWRRSSNKAKKDAAWAYTRAVSGRQEFLWNLNSTRDLAKLMAEYTQVRHNGKVLVFSERTGQASSISNNVVHSKNKKDVNDKNLQDFDDGVITQLGSCYSLTLGLNLKNAEYAIMESYNGSDVQFAQRSGRVDRLPVDEHAIVTIIVPKNTQAETWFSRAVKFDDNDIVKTVNNLSDYAKTLDEFKT